MRGLRAGDGSSFAPPGDEEGWASTSTHWPWLWGKSVVFASTPSLAVLSE